MGQRWMYSVNQVAQPQKSEDTFYFAISAKMQKKVKLITMTGKKINEKKILWQIAS
jgi:hypothetical protein